MFSRTTLKRTRLDNHIHLHLWAGTPPPDKCIRLHLFAETPPRDKRIRLHLLVGTPPTLKLSCL